MPRDVLKLSLSLDRGALAPSETTRAYVIAVVEAQDAAVARPPLSVVFALDVSGSMKGAPLQHVVQSVDRIVSLLRSEDRVGIVAFSHNAETVLALRQATEETKRAARTVMKALSAGQMTNMEAGLSLALDMLSTRGQGDRPLVLLLSDGAPNIGRCTPLTLAEVARNQRRESSVWTLGYGPQHQEDILAAVSAAAGGRYEHIPTPEVSEFFFAKVFGAQGRVVADGITLAFSPGASCRMIRLVGQQGLQLDPREPMLALPDAFVRTRRAIVAEVELTAPATPGIFRPLAASLRHRPVHERTPRTVEATLELPVGIHLAPPAEPMNPDVLLALADEARVVARSLADRGQFVAASSALQDMARQVDHARGIAPDLITLRKASEVLRDEQMTMASAPETSNYRAFRRSRISVSVSTAEYGLAQGQTETAAYAEIMSSVAGDFPPAYLEHLVGKKASEHIPLRGEQILGRAEGCAVVLDSPRVQQEHARILAQGGRFFLMDLGTAHGTWLNDVRIDTHVLTPGDVIGIAEFELQYREGPRRDGELRLTIETSNGETHTVEKTCLFVIGRSNACTLVIDSEEIGRQHAAVRFRDGEYWLEDYGSPSGTYRKGGERVHAPAMVCDGDEFLLAGHPIKFRFVP